MTTAEAMAIAVLKGDMVAARALADHLVEVYSQVEYELSPITHVTTDLKNVRVIVYPSPNSFPGDAAELERMREFLDRWLRGEHKVLVANNVERIELYQIEDKK